MASLCASFSGCSLRAPSRVAMRAPARAVAARAPLRVTAESAAPLSAGGASFDAIIEVGGTQQIVQKGRFYSCNSLNLAAGTKVNFERVLLVKDGEKLSIGQPYVQGATVSATVLEAYRGKKQIVFKMKAKKHYRRKNGHRQELTKFLVTDVTM